jgi:hypothetical protein
MRAIGISVLLLFGDSGHVETILTMESKSYYLMYHSALVALGTSPHAEVSNLICFQPFDEE